MIFTIFALSGSGSLLISDPILVALDLKNFVTFYPLYIFIRILIIIPIYQLMLIIIATIFGEFKYFWQFEKKIFTAFTYNKIIEITCTNNNLIVNMLKI